MSIIDMITASEWTESHWDALQIATSYCSGASDAAFKAKAALLRVLVNHKQSFERAARAAEANAACLAAIIAEITAKETQP